jgi:haloacetate dehalogenase
MPNDVATTPKNDPGRRSFLEHALALLTAAGIPAASGVAEADDRPAFQPAPLGSTTRFFPGFRGIRIETTEAVINGVIGGSGPPVLLLHGWPQTHVQWRSVAATLARRYTVVATDLRGYGDSSKPGDGENHAGHSKRATARDQVELMRKLGFERFSVVAHDRGARVAHRMALDYPAAVTKLAVLDIVPTYKLYTNVTKEFATAYFHWFFLIQPAPLPETLLLGSAEAFLRGWAFRDLVPQVIAEDVYAEYLRCFRDPQTMHAMCEDYRAGATIDLEHDKADLDRKIECPLLALWAGKGAMERMYKVADTWRERATNVSGKALPGSHWLTEQLPDEVCAELLPFLA